MNLIADKISEIVNGTIEGDPETYISSFGKIEEAESSQLTFLSNLKYEEYLYSTNASVVILNKDYKLKQPIKATIIRVADAHAAFVTLLQKYKERTLHQLKGMQQPVYVSTSVQIGKNTFLGAFTYLGENVIIGNNTKISPNCTIADNVQIGENCFLYAGVKIYADTIIKNNVTIHAGAVIGSDGFGFAPQPDGTFSKIPQIGNVVIEDDVEIGANTTIDRATMGSTIIKTGVKLDNLIQIAHNVEIGKNNVIAAQTGISGSTKLGKNVMMGGQVGIVGHITIADGTKVAAQSGITKSIKQPETTVGGSPAMEYVAGLRSHAIIPQLPDIKKRLIKLEQIVKQSISQKENV